MRGLEGSFRDVLWERLESWRDSVGSASDRGGLCRGAENEGSQSGLPLDPALAEVLFARKRASVFGQEADWVFASSLKAGGTSLTIEQDACKPDQACGEGG
jgi:hypothetical protein